MERGKFKSRGGILQNMLIAFNSKIGEGVPGF